ncbi:hypothetical protein [Mycobacterium sp. 3519A]|uniref:hypothetical protein n=1 Tax=Mycobacterium sp. 3519A TaxID=2057184 RepID=UPI000C7C4677|nr:hypothetical protein [Mycobacterium sp. 3519A]
MSDSLQVRGTDLRYLITAYLFDHGPASVNDLVDALAYHGFRTAGRASKAVSEALRREIAQGRVTRLRRGRYLPGYMPRSTEERIYKRVQELHAKVAELTLPARPPRSA